MLHTCHAITGHAHGKHMPGTKHVQHTPCTLPVHKPCPCEAYGICRDGAKLRREAMNSNAEPVAPLPPGGDAYEWSPRRCQLPPLDRPTCY